MASRSDMIWVNPMQVASHSHTCGHCGNQVVSQQGWVTDNRGHGHLTASLYICHFCRRPTFFSPEGKQLPGPVSGEVVTGIDDPTVSAIYEEARAANSAGCFTATILCCRKLLMHVAVSKGASEGDSFASYVVFLRDKGFVPPDAHAWVDHIRNKGNEANHQIVIGTKEDAAELLEFCGVLLKVVFEFPAAMKKRYSKELALASLASLTPTPKQ